MFLTHAQEKGGKKQIGINGLNLIRPSVILFGLPERKIRAARKNERTEGVLGCPSGELIVCAWKSLREGSGEALPHQRPTSSLLSSRQRSGSSHDTESIRVTVGRGTELR